MHWPILANSPRRFQGLCVVETGLPDFHKIVVNIIKATFQRLPPRIRTKMNYNKFYNRETLVKELCWTYTWNNDTSNFTYTCMRSLEKHEPLKKKYTRGSHLLFMNKELSKALMHRLKLCNNFLRHSSNENRKRYCIRNNGITVALCWEE